MTMMMTIMTTEVHFISCHKKRALLRWSKRRQTIRERSKENQGTILLPQYDHDLVPFKKLKYEKVNLELSQVNIRGFTSSLSSSKPRSTTRFFILRNTVSFLWNFVGVFFILDYDSMCSETDFTPEKSNFMLLLEFPIPCVVHILRNHG